MCNRTGCGVRWPEKNLGTQRLKAGAIGQNMKDHCSVEGFQKKLVNREEIWYGDTDREGVNQIKTRE